MRALKEGHLYCHDLLRWSWCGGLRVSAWPWWTETWTLCSWRLLLDRSSPSTSCRYSHSPLRAKGWASSSGWGLFSYDKMLCDCSFLCGAFVNELCVSMFFHQFLLLNAEEFLSLLLFTHALPLYFHTFWTAALLFSVFCICKQQISFKSRFVIWSRRSPQETSPSIWKVLMLSCQASSSTTTGWKKR